MIITTTPSIESAKIESYCGIVTTSIVFGGGFMSDFKTALTDIVGGQSESYQDQLNEMVVMSMDNIQLEAEEKQANAIIGLRMDFDELSAKGKAMFMVTLQGTAVVISETDNEKLQKKIHHGNVSSAELQTLLIQKKISITLDKGYVPTEQRWHAMLQSPKLEWIPKLLDIYVDLETRENCINTQRENMFLGRLPSFLQRIDDNYCIEQLYKYLFDYPEIMLKLLLQVNCFASNQVIKFIEQGDYDKAIVCLELDRSFYSSEDLKNMKEILCLLKNKPDEGEIKEVKGTFGSAKQKYVCPKGHVNDPGTHFCLNESKGQVCGLNAQGYTKEQLSAISDFELKVEMLEEALSQN